MFIRNKNAHVPKTWILENAGSPIKTTIKERLKALKIADFVKRSITSQKPV
ncbi:unnamed protein product [marine sediment metagenome]|uniref:Uncharacterized protein n=1 Tax=marine sediment metagenome TaxID=412755 RepID=X1RPV5_9ZZZZ